MNTRNARRDAAYAAHKREQTRRALSMTMAERLAWLERTLDEMRALHGVARRRGAGATKRGSQTAG